MGKQYSLHNTYFTLFTLEGISRKGHMISTTKRLEQSKTLRNQRSKGVFSLLISL